MAERWKKTRSIHQSIFASQYGIVNTWDFHSISKSSKNLIQRLKKYKVLNGHTGCVNTVAWNDSGTLLLTGSDDYLLNIYDGYSAKLIHSVKSGHRANVFSAKFLPCTSDLQMVSCSGDGMLQYNILGTEYGQNYFNCHSGTTYEVLVTPGDPNSFLSCGEDGTVRMFDLRTKTKCHCQECADDILIDARHAVTSVSINPLLPYHLAVGCKDSFVRVFDRRTLGTMRASRSVNKNRGWMPGLFCKFKPSTLKQDSSCRVTSLQYSNNGEDLLVSYCTDYIYLFKVKDESSIIADTNPSSTSRRKNKTLNGVYHQDHHNHDSDSESTSSELPPVKRLRLRGDWSDTGPQARPEAEEETSPENNLMQRMSELFSRWMEDAMSTTLRHVSPPSTSSEDGNVTPPSPQPPLPHLLPPLPPPPPPPQEDTHPNQRNSRTRTDSYSSTNNRDENAGSLDLNTGEHRGISNVRPASNNSVSRTRPDNEPNENTPLLRHTSSSGNSNDVSDTDRFSSNEADVPGNENDRCAKFQFASNEHIETGNYLNEGLVVNESVDDNAAGGINTIVDDVAGGTLGPVDGDNTSRAGPAVGIGAGPSALDDNSGASGGDDAAGTSNTCHGNTEEVAADEEFQRRLYDVYSSRSRYTMNGSRYTMKRHSAASKIQNFIRLHKERQKEMDRLNAIKPTYMYLPQSKIFYKGHRNARTMIKEANFWGDDFILSGSDCGRIFIWDRQTAELVMVLDGDRHVVNCVQPHPFDPILATSGIDHDVKIWAPLAQQPAVLENVEEIIERNERMLEESRDTITVPAAFVLRMFASLGSIRRNRQRMQDEE